MDKPTRHTPAEHSTVTPPIEATRPPAHMSAFTAPDMEPVMDESGTVVALANKLEKPSP